MTIATIDYPNVDTLPDALRELEEDPFQIRWRTRYMGDSSAIATSWFEIQELVTYLGSRGWEYLIVEPAHAPGRVRWAQCLGRTEVMSVEVARWNPDLHQVDLWRLGHNGPRSPLVDVHPGTRVQEMVRPCQVLTARDAIVAFYDWLMHGEVTGFTREHHIY